MCVIWHLLTILYTTNVAEKIDACKCHMWTIFSCNDDFQCKDIADRIDVWNIICCGVYTQQMLQRKLMRAIPHVATGRFLISNECCGENWCVEQCRMWTTFNEMFVIVTATNTFNLSSPLKFLPCNITVTNFGLSQLFITMIHIVKEKFFLFFTHLRFQFWRWNLKPPSFVN